MHSYFVFLNKIGNDIGLFINKLLNHLFKSIGFGGKIFCLFYYYYEANKVNDLIVGKSEIKLSF